MAKFQLKIIIIRVLTKKTQETQADVQIPPLSSADCCLFLFFFLCLTPIVRSSSRTIASAVDCCVGGQIGWRFLRAGSRLESKIIVVSCLSSSPPPNSWLLHPPITPRFLDLPLNRFASVRGQLFHWSPLPSTSCAEKQLECTIVLPRRLFHQPYHKINGLEGNGGKGRHQPWMVLDGSYGHRPMIRRPSDMVSVVDRWVHGCFCCELCAKKYGTWYVLSQKNDGPRSSLFLTAH